MLEEFKKFALRGNVVDMAVGIIIGGAFGTIVKSMVDDVLMPPIGMLLGNVDFSEIQSLVPFLYNYPQIDADQPYLKVYTSVTAVWVSVLSTPSSTWVLWLTAKEVFSASVLLILTRSAVSDLKRLFWAASSARSLLRV